MGEELADDEKEESGDQSSSVTIDSGRDTVEYADDELDSHSSFKSGNFFMNDFSISSTICELRLSSSVCGASEGVNGAAP